MKKPLDLALPLRVLVGVMFLTIVILTLVQVFARYVLNSPLLWSEELARLLLVWVVFLGGAVNGATPAKTSGGKSLTIRGGLLDDSQRTLIVKALDDNNWNFTRTAANLGIGRTTLWRKVKKYGLKQETASG